MVIAGGTGVKHWSHLRFYAGLVQVDVQVVKAGDFDAGGADLVAGVVGGNPSALVMPATGRTPLGIYAALAARSEPTWSGVGVAQLDEYVGVGMDDPRSLRGWMERTFATPLGISPERVIALDGTAPELAAECRRFDQELAEAGGLDLAIVGLGPNGHLGFNEPPSDADAPTREVALAAESIDSNGAYWGGSERVPRRALTAGMSVILSARRVLLVVCGAHKHRILHRAVGGPVTEEVPASFLQTHAAVTVLVDEAAWHGD